MSDRITHPCQLPLRVHHALGRTSRTGGVEHRRIRIRGGGREIYGAGLILLRHCEYGAAHTKQTFLEGV